MSAEVGGSPSTKAAQAVPTAAEMHASAMDPQPVLRRPLSIDTAWARAHSRDTQTVQMVDSSTLQDYLPNRAFTEPERAPLDLDALDSPLSQLRTNPSGEWPL